MVCAFQGWNDAGDAASSAVSFLAGSLNARRFAQIDSEEFYDFQANRPSIRLVGGRGTATGSGSREIVWPTVEVLKDTRRRSRHVTSCSFKASSLRCAGAPYARIYRLGQAR